MIWKRKTGMPSRTIAGYRDRLSVRPGDVVRFMVSAFDGGSFRADLVRILSGNRRSRHAGLELDVLPAAFAGEYAGRNQTTQCGSYGQAPIHAPAAKSEVAFACAVMPTISGRGAATIACLAAPDGPPAALLAIDRDGHLTASLAVGERRLSLRAGDPLPLRRWSIVGWSASAAKRRACLFQASRPEGPGDPAPLFDGEIRADLPGDFRLAAGEVFFAAAPRTSAGKPKTREHLNGRLDSPRLHDRALGTGELIASVLRPDADSADLVAAWDFAADMGGRSFAERVTGRSDGRLFNLPVRAVKGVRWTGAERCWKRAPGEYGAVHFHEYDLYDCEWQVDFEYRVPDDLPSGCYAARLRKGEEEEFLTFFVLPARGARKSRIAFLAPTASYLAYGNDRVGILVDALLAGKFDPPPEERLLMEHPELGASLYEHHLDGSGTHFSSYLRPIVNLRPGARVWGFTADTDILRWLAKSGERFDVITDDALHREGRSLLEGYSVVVTGTHPEYCTTKMLDSLERYVEGPGRLMYLGGNGFYWKVACSEDWPAAIELRRAEDGTRAWMSPSGEYHHQFDGELGGLWRRQNRAPQKLVGVGFTAQGSARGLRFRRASGADDPRGRFAFAGVDEAIVCDFRRMQANPSAEETDRIDYDLGTPAHALVLASSENPAPDLMRTKEELLIALPQIADPDIRADVVFFETRGGGAVFSTGSIGWSSTLGHADYENPAARITSNVLRRFLDPEPFVVPKAAATPSQLAPQVFDAPPGLRARKLPVGAVLKGAIGRAFTTFALSFVIKRNGFPTLPAPRPRDEQLGVP